MNQQIRKMGTKKARKLSMDEITIGIDIGDLDGEGEVIEEGRLRTVASSVEKH
jgi:hypothetical protein